MSMEQLALQDDQNREYGLDDALPEDLGTLRDHLAKGTIARDTVELAGSVDRFEATAERGGDFSQPAVTVAISADTFAELGSLGVP